jgi:hypothetical protein
VSSETIDADGKRPTTVQFMSTGTSQLTLTVQRQDAGQYRLDHRSASFPLGRVRQRCQLWVDIVEKVVSDLPQRNNRIRTASYLNRR